MATQIILKHSVQPGKLPLPSDLVLGEVAINSADGRMFTLDPNGQVIEIQPGSYDGSRLGTNSVDYSKLSYDLQQFVKGVGGQYLGRFGSAPTTRTRYQDIDGETNLIRKGDFYFNSTDSAFYVATVDAYNGSDAVWEVVGSKDVDGSTLVDGSVTLAKLADEVMALVDTKVAAEGTLRADADAALSARIDNVLSNIDPAALDSLTEIVAAFQAADSDLNTAISTLAANSSTAIATEKARAETAEAALQAAVDSLTSTVSANAASAAAAVAAETSARTSADAYLQSQIDGLKTSGEQAAINFDGAISDVEAALLAAIAAEAQTRASEDMDIRTQVGSVSQSLSADITAERTRAMAAEAALASQVTDTGASLNAEKTRAMAAEQLLLDKINAEVANRGTAEAALGARIDTEVADRIAGDAALAADLETLAGQAEQAINGLETRVGALEVDVAGIHTTLDAMGAGNDAAIQALDSRVSSLESAIVGGTY